MSLNQYEVWLASNQLVCVGQDVPTREKGALLNSSLFFQLAATKKVAGGAQDWFAEYEKVMKAFGWSVVEGGRHTYSPLVLNLGQLITSLDDITGRCRLEAVQALFACRGKVPGQWLQQATHTRHEAGEVCHDISLLLGSAHSRYRLDTVQIQFTVRQSAVPDLLTQTFTAAAIIGRVSVRWLCGEPEGPVFQRFEPIINEQLAKRADRKPILIDVAQGAS